MSNCASDKKIIQELSEIRNFQEETIIKQHNIIETLKTKCDKLIEMYKIKNTEYVKINCKNEEYFHKIFDLDKQNKELKEANQRTYNRNLEIGLENDNLKDKIKLLDVEPIEEEDDECELQYRNTDFINFLFYADYNGEEDKDDKFLKLYLRLKKQIKNLN